jgi:hypothetical protein
MLPPPRRRIRGALFSLEESRYSYKVAEERLAYVLQR